MQAVVQRSFGGPSAREGQPIAGQPPQSKACAGQALELQHILSWARGTLEPLDASTRLDRLIELVAASTALAAAHFRLECALHHHRELSRLADIARGRCHAGRLPGDAARTVEELQRTAHEAVAERLADWTCCGRGFTQVAQLLPSQLAIDDLLVDELDVDTRRLWRHEVLRWAPPWARTRFEEVLMHYLAAQRRCERASQEVVKSTETLHTLRRQLPRGACSIVRLAHAMALRVRHREALLVAVAERATAHHSIGLIHQLLPVAVRGDGSTGV